MFWNLYEAGIDRLYGRDTRWHLQRDLIREHRPRVLMTTEGWGWERNGRAFFEDAKAALGMEGTLFPARTGCNLAVFWQPDIRLLAEDQPPPELTTWHGHGSVTLQLPGRSAPLTCVVAHLDPFSATNRRIESDRLRQYAAPDAHPTLLAMDANSLPPGDPEPDWSTVPRHRRADHTLPGETRADREPLRRLLGDPEDPLFLDAGAELGERAPTFGFHPPHEAPRRIDVFLLTPALFRDLVRYRALDDPRLHPDGERPGASDHRPVALRLHRR
ncbi:endonuclease/exonuclease/phosphatase family protein [Streptomyces sp. HNM0574]|nr:endonuclease/exonuclease/phosphatase family protein [Streptomyces sp. HNM0574]NLU70573.1 endonuclease/exonuclease/phosphatase family protein [Streptomyces sp. HNM0574]